MSSEHVGRCSLSECYGDKRAVDSKGAIAVSCRRCPWHKYVYPNEGIDVKQTAHNLAEDHVCTWKQVLSRFDLDGSCDPPDQRN